MGVMPVEQREANDAKERRQQEEKKRAEAAQVAMVPFRHEVPPELVGQMRAPSPVILNHDGNDWERSPARAGARLMSEQGFMGTPRAHTDWRQGVASLLASIERRPSAPFSGAMQLLPLRPFQPGVDSLPAPLPMFQPRFSPGFFILRETPNAFMQHVGHYTMHANVRSGIDDNPTPGFVASQRGIRDLANRLAAEARASAEARLAAAAEEAEEAAIADRASFFRRTMHTMAAATVAAITENHDFLISDPPVPPPVRPLRVASDEDVDILYRPARVLPMASDEDVEPLYDPVAEPLPAAPMFPDMEDAAQGPPPLEEDPDAPPMEEVI